jgi:hypothetical protein
MEKPGMDRRYRPFRSGLLGACCIGLLLFLLSPLSPGASGPEEGPALITETSPDNPVKNAPWKLSFLVDHPVAGEVTVLPPPLPAALFLEQVRTGGRWIQTAENQNARWTLVEFFFIPQQAGLFSLGPFEFRTPRGRTLSGELEVYVLSEEGKLREYHPRLLWDPYPGALKIGERAELSLRLVDWNPEIPLPGNLPFLIDIPEGAVLEELPLSRTDKERRVILRLGLIPLRGERFSLPSLHSHYEGVNLNSPALNIRVSAPAGAKAGPTVPEADPARPEAPGPLPTAGNTVSGNTAAGLVSTAGNTVSGEAVSGDAALGEAAAIPFPSGDGEVFFLFRDAYRAAAERARTLWEGGNRAEALAGLRRDERDLLAGYTLLPLRRAAEKALGLGLTADEKWRPLKLLAFISLGSGLLLIPAGLLSFFSRRSGASKKISVTFGQSWGYKGVIILLIIILSGGLYGLGSGIMNRGFSGRGSSAVLRGCTAYRVPDPQGGLSTYWDEGQPVRIRSGAEDWAYVETFDGKAGWVLLEEVVFY